MFPTPLSGSLSGYGRGYSDDPPVIVDGQKLPYGSDVYTRATAHTNVTRSATTLKSLNKTPVSLGKT